MIEPQAPETRTPQLSHAVVFFLLWLIVSFLGVGVLGAFVFIALGVDPHSDPQLGYIMAGPISLLLTMLLIAWLLARGRFDARETLSLRPCLLRLYLWSAVTVIALGMIVGRLTAFLLVLWPGLLSENLLNLIRASQFGHPLKYSLFVLAISVGPGIGEELAFRGFILCGLLSRFRPRLAVTLTAILFALVHLDPLQVIMVFPTGIYLGYLVVRTGSLYPAMAAHAFNNLWSTLEAGLWQRYHPDIDPVQILLGTSYPPVVLAIALIGLGAGLYALRRLPHPTRSPSTLLGTL